MTIRKLLCGALGVLLIGGVLAACDSTDPLGPLVILTNSWHDANDSNHTFNLTDDTGFQPKRSGTFTGTEQLGGSTYQLEGSWTETGKIQFTTHRATNVTYRGTLSASNTDRIDFVSTLGALTLVRD